ATYLLPGIVEANESSIPVLGITTDIATTSRGRYALTELDQEALYRPLTKRTEVIHRADKLPEAVRRAFRAMTGGRPGAAHLGLPFDVQNGQVAGNAVWADAALGAFPSSRASPEKEKIAKAAELLVSARLPVFVCGGGVVISGAMAELERLASALGAVVATTVSGQGSLAENHPLCLGVVGSNGGTLPTREALSKADLVVFVGCRAGSVTTERWRYPAPGTRILHIDADAMVIGANYKTEVGLVGDAKLILKDLFTQLGTQNPRNGKELVQKAKEQKFSEFRALAARDDVPILPERVVAALHEILPRDATVVCDPGTPCPYFSAYYELLEAGRHFISNRAHGALGYSMAAALGAHLGRPATKTVSVMGDGSFGFTAGELETLVRLKAPVMMVVISNSSYGWIKAGQKTGFGERYFSVDFSRTDHARVAEAFGVKAFKVEKPEQLKPALVAAAEYGGPALVDVITQPLQDARAPVSEWVA
ncbi:MAG TPA: thiamine pyrophosphate-binding protein, partial [Burkholderiales bacterium]|nr:thiamine pyrophosphate-binding protein [Burkholderiales bacterium]